jgi:hypothetical protein
MRENGRKKKEEGKEGGRKEKEMVRKRIKLCNIGKKSGKKSMMRINKLCLSHEGENIIFGKWGGGMSFSDQNRDPCNPKSSVPNLLTMSRLSCRVFIHRIGLKGLSCQIRNACNDVVSKTLGWDIFLKIIRKFKLSLQFLMDL